jgi:glycosyltransferase involved in cell wall biosynthesis
MGEGRALVIHGPYRGASGHDHHVREFVRHLSQRHIRIQLIDVPEWGPTRLPEQARDPWFDTLGAPVSATAAIHFCMPPQVRATDGLLNVNYTMFEASRIPSRWVQCNRRHDLVVLPTESSRSAWLAASFPDERIRLCPLGIDPDRFHPDVEPLPLADRRGLRVSERRTRVLNVSEFGPRKNVLALLRVWITVTTERDDAILIVKLHPLAPAQALTFMRDLDAVERAIGKGRPDAAPVLFCDQVLADADMPRLFGAATHYWSMSHGEGWDQPMAEAAATGLRLLAPAHTGYRCYLDDSVAAMIPSRQVPAVVAGDPRATALFAGATWWEPSEDAAAQALRVALSGADKGRPSARARMVERFTWQHAVTRLIEILEELHERRGRMF